jgi:hypothetical protein
MNGANATGGDGRNRQSKPKINFMAVRKKVKPAGDLKSEFLTELAARYKYWAEREGLSKDEHKQAMEYAKAYERMMCVFTQPAPVPGE